jgi:hypothetical protein
MDWQIIQERPDALLPVEGGFTKAIRGIFTTPQNRKVFVKIGVDPITKTWAKKEIDVYKSLQACGYKYIPKLISINDDECGFALEYLGSENGWEWETPWTDHRLGATLRALDELATLPRSAVAPGLLEDDEDDINVNPWQMCRIDQASEALLNKRLHDVNRPDIAERLKDLKSSLQFTPDSKVLVHYDVRRDNCAWNPRLETVKLIDWNWLRFGSQKIDVCALLVNAYKAGLSLKNFTDRLDYNALMWLTGYWLSSSIQPGSETMSDPAVLRSYQFDSAIAAYDLATEIRSA